MKDNVKVFMLTMHIIIELFFNVNGKKKKDIEEERSKKVK